MIFSITALLFIVFACYLTAFKENEFYTVYLFTENILNINKKARTDAKIKLYNKSGWDEYLNEK